MENINMNFRIRELIEPKEKRTSKSKIPVKTQFQQVFERKCRAETGKAINGYMK